MGKQQEHLTFNLENTSDGPQPFNVFGASYNGFKLSTANVSVNVPQSSVGQAQADNLNTAFTIKEMKIRVSDTRQLDVPFYIKTKQATGELGEIPFTPSDYTNPANEQDKLIDTGNIDIKIYGNVGFTGTILPHSKMTLSITVEYDYRPSNFIERTRNFFNTRAHRLMNLAPNR